MVSKRLKTKHVIYGLVILIIILSIIGFFILDKISGYLYEQPSELTYKLQRFTNMDFYPLLEYANNQIFRRLFRFIDEINIFRRDDNLLDGSMPIYELKLSAGDIAFFDIVSKAAVERGYLGSDGLNKLRKAELKYDGKTYEVQVKLHGDTPKHYKYPMKSYTIKTLNNESIGNKTRFTMRIFEERTIKSAVGNIIARDLGLPQVQDDIVVLKINGVTQGMYSLAESIDADFANENGFSRSVIVKITDNTIDDHKGETDPNGVFNPEGHYTVFDYELGNLKIANNGLDLPKVQGRVYEFFDAINKDDGNTLHQYLDVDEVSSYEAARTILANPHDIAGDNLNLIYSSTNEKFYPIIFAESIGRLQLINGGFQNVLNREKSRQIPLFHLISQDDEIRYERNKKLYSLVTSKQDQILSEVNGLVDKYLPYAQSYKTNELNTEFVKYALNIFPDYLANNFRIIKQNLEYSKVYLGARFKDNTITIEVIPDSIAELRFDSLKINLAEKIGPTIAKITIKNEEKVIKETDISIPEKIDKIDLTQQVNGLFFSAGLDENDYPAKRKYTVMLTFEREIHPKVISLDALVVNDITGKRIADDDEYINIANLNKD
jgi:hypothetical protein